MTCGSEGYQRTKDKTVRLPKNYHMSKDTTRTITFEKGVSFARTIRNTKTSNTNKKKRIILISLQWPKPLGLKVSVTIRKG